MFAGVLGTPLNFNLGSSLSKFYIQQFLACQLSCNCRRQEHNCFTMYKEKGVPTKTNKTYYLTYISLPLKIVANLWLSVTGCSESEINSSKKMKCIVTLNGSS